MHCFLIIISCSIWLNTEARYGKRYFYDPFNDWDNEYYDASLEDLHLAAPPPPVPPNTPAIQADSGFSLPPIPLPMNLPSGGPNFAAVTLFSGAGPNVPFGGGGFHPPFAGPGGNFGGFGGIGGFGDQNYGPGIGFLNPVGGYNGQYPIGQPFDSSFGNGPFNGGGQLGFGAPFGGGSPFGFPNIGGYGAHSGFGGPGSFGGGSTFGDNFGINIPPPFGTYTGPNTFRNQFSPITSPPRLRPRPSVVVRPFSNYDAIPARGGFPIVPNPVGPSSYVNYPVGGQRPYNYLPYSSNLVSDIVLPAASRNSIAIGPVIQRDVVCCPLRRPVLTGVCRSSFDVINRRACVNMETDGKSQECLPSQLCCYWWPAQKADLEDRAPPLEIPLTSVGFSESRRHNARVRPSYLILSRKSPPDQTDYFRVGSRIVRPADDEVQKTGISSSEVDTHDDTFDHYTNPSTPPVVPEEAAAERSNRVEVHLVPRTVEDSSPARICGKMGVNTGIRMGKILRGTSVDPGEMCWQAAIFSGNEFLCGGALVTATHVITSAHCVKKFQSAFRDLTVVLGITNVASKMPGPCTRVIPVKSISIPPNYNAKTLSNDIAVVQLSRGVADSNCTCTLCLPEIWTGPVKLDSNCLVTGYGQSGVTSVSTYGKLRSAQVQIINSATGPVNCQKILDNYSGMMVDYNLDSSMFCSISRDEHLSNGAGAGDACIRDNGSPLICALDADAPNRWTIAGVVTWGLGCGRTTETKPMPSVYTNVRRQLEWISKNVE